LSSRDTTLSTFGISCTPVFELQTPEGDPIPAYFSDTRGSSDANTFDILYSEDPNFIGEWKVQLKAYFNENPANAVLSNEYTIVVNDPCDPPGMTLFPTQSFNYVITDNIGASHQSDLTSAFNSFVSSIDPSFCYSRITYRNDDPTTTSAFSFDPATDVFSINQIMTLDLLGENKDQITKTVYFDVYYGYDCEGCIRGVQTVPFTITLKNPCIDKNYVAIQ